MTLKSRMPLDELNAAELINECGKSIDIAMIVLNDDKLLNKLGCHKVKGRLFGSSYFWDCFNSNLSKDSMLSDGYYLFEFLKLNRKVYELALERKITDRLSAYQREALENYFYNDNDHQFYKQNSI